MRFLLSLTFVLLVLAHPARAEENQSPAPAEAERIYDQYGGAIYQVQTIDLATGKKSGIGSGFQFTADGLIATNYHVVSGAVRHPENARLEYLHDTDGSEGGEKEGDRGSLKILAVDVMRDLAILQMDVAGTRHLSLGRSDLPKGSRLYALGNPHDIGFTIIEGTYNGYSKDSFAEKIHFSGSLNPGMSGGPVLARDGSVVGVNVSTAGNQISFLVPVEPLADLAKDVEKRGRDYDFVANANTHINAQLLEGQEKAVSALLGATWESVPFGPFMVPGKVHDALKCWGMPLHQDKDPYKYHRSFCATQDRVFLGDEFDTGRYGYRYDYLTSETLDPFRFTSLYEREYSSPAGRADGTEDDVTNFDCADSFVRAAGRKWKASFCVRRYKLYPDVWDLSLYMAMTPSSPEGMIMAFGAQGVSRANALALAQRFISEIREKLPEDAVQKAAAAAVTAAQQPEAPENTPGSKPGGEAAP